MGWQRIYKAHEDLKNVYKHATSRAPTQSLPWWTRTRENVLKNTWVCTKATVWSPGPLRITLFAHIRFLKSLRSTTASPILSHFHTLLHHTHTHTHLPRLEPISVKHSIFNKCSNPNLPLRTFTSRYFQWLVRFNPSTALVIQVFIIIQWPCDLHKDGPDEQRAVLQGPSI